MGSVLSLPRPAANSASRPTPALRVLTPQLAKQLRQFNEVWRALRAAAIPLVGGSQADLTIFIDAEQAPALVRAFRSELRGMLARAHGRVCFNSVLVRGVRILWTTPIKEQD